MANVVKPLIVRYKNKDWKPFLENDMTEAGMKFLTEENALRGGGQWCHAYHKGSDPKTATEWIIVTNNGWYFKVGACYMIWHRSSSGAIVAQAIWSTAHLKKSVRNLIEHGTTLPDPGYTT